MTSELHRRNGAALSSRSRLALCAAAVACVAAWLGCKHENVASTAVDPVGTYTLVTVDGRALPCKVAHEGSPTVKSGVFHIDADGTCSSKITFAVSGGSDMVREVKAQYSREGVKLIMKWEGAGMTTGRVDRDAFTMNNEGNVFAYRK